ncbi:hypothetical protein [Formosa sp. L2A11]|uniref:hypothetical protein n=1 Tax=Formosa sp. L2A11 TaxID=2686363 RepID=UPI00131A8C81|nr:hypothetical protein [Formosa sp. L2A11]
MKRNDYRKRLSKEAREDYYIITNKLQQVLKNFDFIAKKDVRIFIESNGDYVSLNKFPYEPYNEVLLIFAQIEKDKLPRNKQVDYKKFRASVMNKVIMYIHKGKKERVPIYRPRRKRIGTEKINIGEYLN